MKTPSKPKPEIAVPPAPPKAVTNLSQLEQLSNGAPLIVDLKIRDQVVRFTERRLKPVESKEVKLILERALPPILPPEKEGMPARYDYRDPGYLRRLEEDKRQARALALHTAFPLFAEALAQEAPNDPVDAQRICQFIESRSLDDDILEALFARVYERQVDAATVSFS